MAKITNYTGIMNYLGGRFLAEQAALEPVMRDIGKRGLLFLDDGSSAQSLSGGIAKAISAPQGFADILLDGEVTEASILRKLDELERVARRNGQAIDLRPRCQLRRRLAHHPETGAERAVITLPLARQLDATRLAKKQLHTKPRLQLPDLQTDGAGRDIQLVGGKRDAAIARCGLEGLQPFQRREFGGHDLAQLNYRTRNNRLKTP